MSSGVDPIIQRELKLNQGRKQANNVMKKTTCTTTEHHQIQEDKIQQKLITSWADHRCEELNEIEINAICMRFCRKCFSCLCGGDGEGGLRILCPIYPLFFSPTHCTLSSHSTVTLSLSPVVTLFSIFTRLSSLPLSLFSLRLALLYLSPTDRHVPIHPAYRLRFKANSIVLTYIMSYKSVQSMDNIQEAWIILFEGCDVDSGGKEKEKERQCLHSLLSSSLVLHVIPFSFLSHRFLCFPFLSSLLFRPCLFYPISYLSYFVYIIFSVPTRPDSLGQQNIYSKGRAH